MTRTRALLFVVFAFIATLAFGQTYVRPSKGAPVPAFAGYADAGISLAASGTELPTTILGTQFEWTAFETLRVRIAGRAGTGTWGQSCGSVSMQYNVADLGTVVRAQLLRVGSSTATSWALIIYDAAAATSTYQNANSAGAGFTLAASNNSVMLLSSKFLGCNVDVTFVPVPFAVVTQEPAPFQCRAVYQNTYLMDGGIILMGVARGARAYTIVCNSKDNTSGNLRCRADDAGVVSTTAGSLGDVLGVGDCINYSNPVANPIHCIGGGIYATTFECTP